MRSTMTRYPEGFPIFVPVSVRNSAVMPCGRPSVLTRSRNAGGKEYSRPQSRPTLMSDMVGSSGLFDAFARFRDDRAHDRAEVAGLAVHLELALGARALGEDVVDVLDFPPAPQVVHHVVDEREQLDGEIAHRHLGALAEVDQV